MKNKLFALAALTWLAGTSMAQKTIDKSNCREGENIEYCLQHKKIKELALTNPGLYNEYLLNKTALKKESSISNQEKTAVLYTVPVVFHVLHLGGEENISMEQIKSALVVLNRDFRRLNADANTVQTPFIGMPADIEIEFKLATKDPNGTCFNGVTRTYTSLTNDGNDGELQVSAVVNGNDVYIGQWPPTKYLNVYIATDIGGAAGYTHNPGIGSTSMYYNGIFVQHSYLGDTGTSSVFTSRTLTHEVGHWLNLDHVWGGNNNPGNVSSCSDDDDVLDTPLCIGLESCNLLSNSCDDTNPAPGTSSSWTTNVVDNAENYMDYSYCSKMFTPGQASRMRTALASSISGRNNLWTTSNLNSVGAGSTSLCKAQFNATKTTVCSGEVIQFNDETYNGATGWTWSFPGGLPASSTSQSPSITYSTPGVYQVSLIATDGSTSDTETKTAYITVLNNAASLPFLEGFENYNTLASTPNWSISNPGNNSAFEITTTAAHTGSKSIKLSNFGQPADNTDELIASAVDLTGVSSNNITLSFRYAYRKKTSSDFEYLKVFLSSNCGTTWSQKKTLAGSVLGNITATSAWTPSAADWVTVHVTSSAFTNAYMNSSFRYKFTFESDGGNNIYIDDINIYEGSASDELVLVGLSENQNDINQLELFPNPSSEDVTIRFTTATNQEVDLLITDITGKVIANSKLNAITGENMILLDATTYSKGLYLVTLKSQGTQKSLQFIKQ